MRILIIEDHQLVRDMAALACRTLVAGATVELAGNAAEGIASCRRAPPDLVFLDLVLPDADGLDLVGELSSVAPSAKIIALTSFTDEFTVHRALRANIHGFIDKNAQPLDVLEHAVQTVLDGGRYYSAAVEKVRTSLRADPTSFAKLLSEHEQKLLSLFGEGLSNEAVAERLELSATTVKAHRRNILAKLGIHSTPELMNYALEKGFTRVRRKPA